MALFKSQVLTQASGSVGGLTYSHANGGMYMRARSMPVNPNTANQQAVKAALTLLVTRWSSVLTSAQRTAWDLYAANVTTTNALGDPITLSGQNWYVATNTPRLQAAAKLGVTLALKDAAPVIFDRGTFTTPTISALQEGASIEIAFTNTDDWATAVGGALYIYQGRPRNVGRTFFRGPYRLIAAVIGAVVPPVSPATITLADTALFGFPISVDQAVTFAFSTSQIDGRLSTRREVTGIVTV